ncbi:hypothetical protein [Rhizobium leguminosarum]|uniref:hypothetical protein n=1 Tax=Rhizobium leguminosarum TaxID=384 RepID=UPI0013EEFEBE|nr:hypothetical protein [Rhizobium leguminosarum]
MKEKIMRHLGKLTETFVRSLISAISIHMLAWLATATVERFLHVIGHVCAIITWQHLFH